jgi:hypothetical protein
LLAIEPIGMSQVIGNSFKVVACARLFEAAARAPSADEVKRRSFCLSLGLRFTHPKSDTHPGNLFGRQGSTSNTREHVGQFACARIA